MKNDIHIKIIDYIYSFIFSTLVLILLVSFIFSVELSLSTLSTNFRWRKDLIKMYDFFSFKLGDQVYNNVLVGKDGWLFYTGDKSIAQFQNTNPLRRAQLIRLQEKLDSLQSELEGMGVTLLVVIPPNKSTVYPQYMPDQIPILGKKSSLDLFLEYMKQNSETKILDLRQGLIESSQVQDVYYRTDSHWNDFGAYQGYVKIMETLSINYPILAPHPRSDFDYVYTGKTVHDLARAIGLHDYMEDDLMLIPRFKVELLESNIILSDGLHKIRSVTNANKDLPSLLVFGDSFYDSLSHFIEPHFSGVQTIPFTSEDGVWSLSWIEQFHPDVVIVEFVERYLDTSLPALLDN